MFDPLPKDMTIAEYIEQARALAVAAAAGDAADQIPPWFGDPRVITFKDAQRIIAHRHGFSGWDTFTAQGIAGAAQGVLTPDQRANTFLHLVSVLYTPDATAGPHRFDEAAALLADDPAIHHENIYTAAAIGDVSAIDRWLKIDPTLVNQKGGYFHWTPLMYAAYARLPGHSTLNAALRLLDAGADPNAYYMWAGQYKFTVLTGVFGRGEGGPIKQPEHPDMLSFARALLAKGANPNDSQAAYNRMFEPDNTCLELLIDYGLNGHDKNNWMLVEDDKLLPHPSETMHFQLIQSIRYGNVARAKLLIDKGVALNTPDDTYDSRHKGKSPYEAAMLMGQSAIADLLLRAGAVQTDLTPLAQFEAACMRADLAMAQSLRADHPTLMAQLEPRRRALICDAVKLKNKDALQVMIALGLDINDPSGRTPLHDAAITGNTDIIQMLLEAGADSKIRHPDHFQPPLGFALYMEKAAAAALLDTAEMDVFTACSRGNLGQLEKRLAENPAHLNIRFVDIRTNPENPCTIDWFTPLANAVASGQADIVRALIDRGADQTITDGADRSILSLAQEHGDKTIIAMLDA